MIARHVQSVTRYCLMSLVLLPAAAQAQKKKAANTMSFDTADAVEHQPVAGKRKPPQSSGKQGPASKTLERALKLYDAEDYPMSSIELNKVCEGQTGDDEANRQRAEFFMGKTLFNMKYYSASLSYFDRIVQKGPAHRYYSKTLQWLASLSRFLPDSQSTGVLEKIGKYTRADLDQPALEPVRDELYYLLGRYYYSKAQFKEAIELFRGIPDSSQQYYAPARFFEGVAWARQNKGKEASDAFKEILRKVKSYVDEKKVPARLKEFEQLANLSLGRIFYTNRQYAQSIKYYERIPGPDARGGASIDWLPSLFEASWAYFQLDNDSKALGNIHSINSPFFENEFYPESYILKAVIYFSRCNYDRSYEAVTEFNALYPDLRKEIEDLLAKHPDNAEFFEYVSKIKEGKTDLVGRVQKAAEGALNDRTLVKNLEYVAALDRQLNQLEKADPAWKSTAIAGAVLQDVTLQKSLAINEAGNLARQRLKRLANEIQDLTKQAIKVEYETLGAQKGVLSAGLATEQVLMNPNAKNFNRVQLDDEHQQWPFRGEYWRDELGYYRFKVQNKCGR